MLMYQKIKERCDLAATYAEDGAYTRAAEILEEIARETRQHAGGVSRMMGEITARTIADGAIKPEDLTTEARVRKLARGERIDR